MVTADQAERRRAELKHAQDSLRAELKYWKSEATEWPTADEPPPLEKHQSQIESVARMLGEALNTIGDGPADTQSERILDLHHVWDFFRVKLAVRYIAPIRGFLDAADELAWAAYSPAVRSAAGSSPVLREPPLVFLDRGTVPFAAARGRSYRDLLPRDVRTRAGADAASGLPFPVIGLPWYLTSHVPGVLLVGHEVGHHIEDDCGLTSSLARRLAVADLPGPRQDVWRPWLGEVFADIVASVSCGAAYPTVLIDALAAAPAGGAGLENYPPSRVRARVCVAAVTKAELPVDAQLIADSREMGGPDQAEDEAQKVVTALLSGPYDELGGRTLPAVLTSPAIADTNTGAKRLLAGIASNLSGAPAILAAAALAFARDPDTYDQRLVGRRAIDEVLRQRPKGPRFGSDLETREARDVEAGRLLLSKLSQLT